MGASATTALFLGDRNHTLLKNLRLHCMPKILHWGLGAVKLDVAIKDGPIALMRHANALYIRTGEGGYSASQLMKYART